MAGTIQSITHLSVVEILYNHSAVYSYGKKRNMDSDESSKITSTLVLMGSTLKFAELYLKLFNNFIALREHLENKSTRLRVSTYFLPKKSITIRTQETYRSVMDFNENTTNPNSFRNFCSLTLNYYIILLVGYYINQLYQQNSDSIEKVADLICERNPFLELTLKYCPL